MLLAIDIGNTNTVFGIYENNTLLSSFRLTTSINKTSDELAMDIFTQYSYLNIDIKKTTAVIISSVVPNIMHTINNCIMKLFNISPLIVGDNISIPIENLYENPNEVGMDRLVNGFFAKEKYGYPLIVIDFGTATTFDVINNNGAYMGGVIFPGIITSMDALFNKTAKLPKIDILRPKNVIGRSTVESLQSGAVRGYVGVIEGICKDILGELNTKPKIIATGGMGRMMSTFTDIIQITDINLTLDALMAIYNHHISK